MARKEKQSLNEHLSLERQEHQVAVITAQLEDVAVVRCEVLMHPYQTTTRAARIVVNKVAVGQAADVR